MPSLALYRNEPQGVIYSNPTEPDYTVRFKTTSAQKNISGVATTNYITEIIINDKSDVTIGGTTVEDSVSVRVKVSGSLQSTTRKKEILLALVADLENWADESVFEGFNPQTAPTIPVVV